ncbi:ATP-binding protein, partial [Streptomyces sp. NPDC058953]
AAPPRARPGGGGPAGGGRGGPPPPPAAGPPAARGRGLCLIEELADHVHFSNRPGRGAVVSFDKILKWREDALLKVS